jgi:ribosomal protein L20
MTHRKEIKMKYTSVLFNFKTKEIEVEQDMTAEIMINEP